METRGTKQLLASEQPALLHSWLCRIAVLSLWLLVANGCDMSPSAGRAAQPSPTSRDQLFKNPRAQALALAAEQGNAAEVQRLITQEKVNPDVIFANVPHGMPLLAWPIFKQNPAGLKALLDSGANPNARKPGQHTQRYSGGSGGPYFDYDNAIAWAGKQNDPIYLTLLLDHGADPSARNGNDETPIFQAQSNSMHNQWPNVQLLVERGADINAVTDVGTVIYDYSCFGRFEEVYWLLQHGADPTIDVLSSPRPPAPRRHRVIESIFWYADDPRWARDFPKDPKWQRLSQQWLLQHGVKRPPMPAMYRDERKGYGLPYEEKDIPLM